MAQYPYIAVEGVIGVGKTTLVRMLAPELGASTLLEVFEENPFLSNFYSDRARYAFQTQIFFLLSRYRQQHQAIPQALARGPLLSDYTFAKDSLFAHLNLNGDELAVYDKLHTALAEKIPTPDLVVYLRADLDTLMARIEQRDRPYERGMDRAYIESLRLAYDGFFSAFTAAPVLMIDFNHLDIIRDPRALADVRDRICAALPELSRHAPATDARQPHQPLTTPGKAEGAPPSKARREQLESASVNQAFLTLMTRIGQLSHTLAEHPAPDKLQTSLEECLQGLLDVAARAGVKLKVES